MTNQVNSSESTTTLSVDVVENRNALFRNPDDTGEQFNSPLHPLIYDYTGDSDSVQDILQPLLPPQINYNKVNKYAPFNNDTSDFFNTFYFHPSFNNILLLVGLVSFTLWVVVMNSLTVIGLLRTHRTGHMADFYLANLAFADTLLGILVLPLMSVVILCGYFPFTNLVCDVWVFVDYYLIVATSFGSCAMMCNYLWMMKWPATFPIDAKHHALVIVFCWIAVNFSWTPSFFNDRLYTSYPQGHCGFSISRNQYFSFYIGISGFYIPLAVSLLCGIWSLGSLKTKSSIPLLSWRQSLSIGRRKRSSRLANEVILEVDLEEQKPKDSKFTKSGGRYEKHPPKYFGPGAESQRNKHPKRPQLKHQQSITRSTDPKMIAQMAKDHYPLVVTSLVLFIVCRSLFYVYFGVGSFVPNFLPLDLSNGVYWLMHSNAAISPLVHLAFDPELREEFGNMLGIRRNPHRSCSIKPVTKISCITSPSDTSTTTKPKVGSIKESVNNVSKESTISNWSHFSAHKESEKSESPLLSAIGRKLQVSKSENEKLGQLANVDVNKNPQILDVHKCSIENGDSVR